MPKNNVYANNDLFMDETDHFYCINEPALFALTFFLGILMLIIYLYANVIGGLF